MKNVNFKIKGQIPKNTTIQVDGKDVKFKKNKNNNLILNHQTESSKVNITMRKYLELNAKHWFFWQMLFFFVTIFGIFDQRADKKCLTVDVKLDFYLQDDTTDVELKFNKQLDGKKAVEVTTSANVFEAKNLYAADKACKKKLKTLKTAKILSVVGIGVLVAVLLIVLL